MFTNETLMQFTFSFKDTFLKNALIEKGRRLWLAVSNLTSHAAKKREIYVHLKNIS